MRTLQHLALFLVLFCFPFLAQAVDYYWVGGSGNWSDISHWATTSGGNVFHNVAPTANDNVIFDANSFTGAGEVVVVNNDNIFCRDMVWDGVTGNPTLSASDVRVLNVFGSIQLSPDMQFDFRGDVVLAGTDAGHVIDMAGHPVQRNFFVEGSGGEWTLQSALAIGGTFEFRTGSLYTEGFDVEVTYFNVRSTGAGHLLDLGTSRVRINGVDMTINFPFVYASFLQVNPNNTAFGNATLEFTSPLATLWGQVTGGTLSFGNVIFSSTNGRGVVYEENRRPYSIDSLAFANNGRLENPLTMGHLALAPGRTYLFSSGLDYTFSGLEAAGDCANPISVFASQAGSAARFTYQPDGPAEDVQLQFVSLKDITVDDGGSGITLEVIEGVDLGNTDGWTIVPKTTDQLFWVGGTGNWDDPANWSLTSGGPGGACVPTAGDDVIFDANSFTAPGQSVNINVENAYCRSMIWDAPTGTPQLAGTAEQELHVYGDLLLSNDMNFSFLGNVYFESLTPDRLIRSAGHSFARNIFFRSAMGGWVQEDELRVLEDIHIISGTWNTNYQDVFCQDIFSSSAFPRTLEWTSSTITCADNFGVDCAWNATNLNLDAGTSRLVLNNTAYISVTGTGDIAFHWVMMEGGGRVIREMEQSGDRFDILVDSLSSDVWTYFRGPISLAYARLAAEQVHRIHPGDTLTVGTLEVPSACGLGPAEISTEINGETAYLLARQDNVLERMVIKDVHAIGMGIMNAQNSTDLGNTDGWMFSNDEPRTLYWVGGSGNWNDPAHWSDTSGGPGGQCIPTPRDDVIFDANSFSAPGQTVDARTGSSVSFCRNMTWTPDIVGMPLFTLRDLQIFGSLMLTENMQVDADFVWLRASEDGQLLDAKNHFLQYLYLRGTGEWRMESPVQCQLLTFQEGTFRSNSFGISLEGFTSTHARPKTLDFGGSHWTFRGDQRTNGYRWYHQPQANLSVAGTPGLIEAVGAEPIFDLFSPLLGHIDLLFSNENGVSQINQDPLVISRLGSVTFRNDGIIRANEMYLDTLILSAGKAYQLQANGIFYIEDYLQMIGNNCTPIQLSSTAQGTQAEIRMADGFVKSDFVQMRDQRAAGANTDFFAGRHSTDIGNSNTGWLFQSRREFQNEGFLGSDVVLCENQTVTLNANNFSPGEQYRWQDGSADSIFVTDQAGIYWAEVTFANSCTIRDSVQLLAPQQFAPDLPNDTLLCQGESLLLTPSPEYAGLLFEWQDGSTEPTYLVDEEGEYKVTLTLNNCSQSDSVVVDFQAPPAVDLGNDQTLCADDSLQLDAGPEGNFYEWQDNTTASTYTVTQPGTYRVQVVREACTVFDSVTIDYYAPIPLDLGGPDTAICEEEVVLLDASVNGATYSWQDGSTNAALGALEEGQYAVTVTTANGCTASDSIEVIHIPLPRFDLGTDTAICADATITFDGQVDMNTTYAWSTGATAPTITTNQDGLYSLTTTRNGCSFQDEVNLTIKPLPVVDLGPAQTACEGEAITLDASYSGASYSWQDGSDNATYTATQNGTYRVTLDLDGCFARDSVDLSFTPLPDFDLGQDTLLCPGETLPLDATVNGGTYAWQDGSSGSTLVAGEDAIYWVDVTADGCTDRDSIQVDYPQFPDDLLPDDQILCEGDVFPIALTVPQATYEWQDGQTGPFYEISEDGTYSVVARVGRCTEQDQLSVVFNPIPVFELGRDTILCEDQSLTLSVDVMADTYSWNNGATGPQIEVSTAGEVVATAQLDNCSFSDQVFVDIQQKSNLDLGPDTTFCEDLGYRLQVNVGGDEFIWQDGSTGPSYQVGQTGAYSVQVLDRQCVMEDTIVLESRECYRFQSYVPTAFSPDGQEPNNTFRPFFPPTLQIEAYEINIMDRWGNIVFSSTNPDAEWDGTRNGEMLPVGVYAYIIKITYIDDYRKDDEIIMGDVAIIR